MDLKTYALTAIGVLFLLTGWNSDARAAACSITQPSLTGSGGQPSTINSEFGMRTHPVSGAQKMHTGTDINTPGSSDCNQPVLVQEGCTRKSYGPAGGYGNRLVVDCGNGVELSYAHLNSYNAATNTAYVGTTGTSTGCHLHFETRIDNKAVDPQCVFGGGDNCPAQISGGKADLCNPAQRNALKNHDTSVGVSPTSANDNTGTNSTTKTTQNPNGSTTQTTTTQNQNGSTTTNATTNSPDGTTSTTTTTTQPDGSTTTTTVTVYPDNEIPVINTSSTPPTPTPPPTPEPQTPAPTTPPGETPAGSELVPTTSGGGGKLSGCAVDTWTGMVNQAVLESRRETVINQTYITKPDSVLVYGCFKHWLKSVQDNAGPIFNETQRFAPPVNIASRTRVKGQKDQVPGFAGRGAMALDVALAQTVFAATDSYLNANFNHNLLGGTSNIAPGDMLNCGIMQEVWKAAKCNNIAKEKAFYTFDEMISEDPRKFPASLACNDTGIKQEMIDWAKNKDFEKVKYDKVKTRLEYMTHPSSCELSVPTGIKVHRRVASGETSTLNTDVKDVVCSNVGCASDMGTCKKN